MEKTEQKTALQNEPIEKSVWLNSKEAAQYLRISVGALRTAIGRGRLRPYRWGRRLYFKRVELDRMIEASRYGQRYF